MKILVLGGTGAMGKYLVNILADQNHQVTVTSRRSRQSHNENIRYIVGDAHNNEFLKGILSEGVDAVIDFMVYGTAEFKNRYDTILNSTAQYVFFSSSRVYANSSTPIVESSPRLFDITKDEEYLKTDEYALAKARQENMLFQSNKKNWTIIRPYITYSNARLQLGVLEKELWLQRALWGGKIVFGSDIASKRTTLTYGEDVARVVSKLIGNDKAIGLAVHITGEDTILWSDVLNVYLDAIERSTGKRPKVCLTDNSQWIASILHNQYQISVDRIYDRVFDNSLAEELCGGKIDYTPIKIGLEKCLTEFLEGNREFLFHSCKFEACADKIAGEHTSFRTLRGIQDKIKYAIAYSSYKV